MYNGKYTEKPSYGKRAARRRRRRIRNTTLCFALILLLGITIGGTIAYLARETDSIVNDFIPANVTIDIQEKVNNNTKEEIVIENQSNVPVYIRVALVGNWADAEDKICINHTGSPLSSLTPGDNWKKGDDGFYYYTESVAVGGKTTDLLDSAIELTLADDGCSYQLEVIASAIQAQGDNGSNTAVYDAWGIDPASLQ